jgi:hypothetical protein
LALGGTCLYRQLSTSGLGQLKTHPPERLKTMKIELDVLNRANALVAKYIKGDVSGTPAPPDAINHPDAEQINTFEDRDFNMETPQGDVGQDVNAYLVGTKVYVHTEQWGGFVGPMETALLLGDVMEPSGS